METKMKGLLKGLRYISQIFDSKEPEMQIGYPTDVKHVAHIGWDNQPSNNNPSWMSDYKPGDPNPRGTGPENWPPTGFQNDYQGRELTQDKQPTRPPRRTSSGDTASPKNVMSPSSRQTQRRHSASSTTGGYDASYQVEPNDGSGKYRSKSRNIVGMSSDSSQPDVPAVPKQNRRRKTKGSSGGGSSKSKSKGAVPAQELEVEDQVAMTNMGSVLATNTNR